MAKAKSPAYQWYPRDYISDALVVSMTLEQEGAYRRLLDVQWLEGGLPEDPEQLWRLAGASTRVYFEKKIWPIVRQKFLLKSGLWINRRLERERVKQGKANNQRRLAALSRWKKTPCERNASASPPQSFAFAIASTTADGTKSTAAAARQRPVENSEGTFALYCVIAREALDRSRTLDQDDTVSNIAEHFKLLCAARGLICDSDLAARAIAATTRPPLRASTGH